MNLSYLPQDTVSSIKYIKDIELYKKEKPFQILIDIPKHAPDQRHTNVVYEEREEIFNDVRGKEQEYSLDDHGFTYRHYDFAFDEYQDRAAVEAKYLPKLEEFIKREVQDVDKVFFFDWRVCIYQSLKIFLSSPHQPNSPRAKQLRHNATIPINTTIDLNEPTNRLTPAVNAHVGELRTIRGFASKKSAQRGTVDQSPGAALNRTLLQLSNEADFLLQGRVRVIT